LIQDNLGFKIGLALAGAGMVASLLLAIWMIVDRRRRTAAGLCLIGALVLLLVGSAVSVGSQVTIISNLSSGSNDDSDPAAVHGK
jgi:hypothetical protein